MKTVHVGQSGKSNYNVHVVEDRKSYRIVRENLTQIQAYRHALALANEPGRVEQEWELYADRDVSLAVL